MNFRKIDRRNVFLVISETEFIITFLRILVQTRHRPNQGDNPAEYLGLLKIYYESSLRTCAFTAI